MKKLFCVFLCWLLSLQQSSAQAWRPLPGGSLNGSVDAIISFNGYLWVSGSFTQAGSITTSFVVRHNGVQWITTPGLSNPPFGFCIYNNELYALGGFDLGPTKYGMMKWTGSTWSPLGVIDHGYMKTGTVYKGELVTGGRFFTVDGTPIANIARFNGTSWGSFLGVTSCFWSSEPDIEALYSANGKLYFGGAFDVICGTIASCAAKWDSITWVPLNLGWNTYASDFILYGGDVYVCGIFQNAGPAVSQAIGKEDTVLGDWVNVGNGVNMNALSMALYQGKLYIAGQKDFGGGNDVGNCGYWDGSLWVPDNQGLYSSTFETIYILYIDPNTNVLYAGGTFNGSQGDTADYIAYKGNINLPITLLSFTCEKSDGQVLLEWQTSAEVNADHFSVAVSEDGTLYREIGEVLAEGNTTSPHSYSFPYTPYSSSESSGVLYFRLQEFDTDGLCGGTWDCSVCVSPSSLLNFDSSREMITCPACTDEVGIFSITGVCLEKRRAPISVNTYTPGMYIAKESISNTTLRFVKE